MESASVMLRLSLELSVGFFLAAVWLLWVVHIPVHSPERLTHLSRQQRQKRVRIAGWICSALSAGCLVRAFLLYIGG